MEFIDTAIALMGYAPETKELSDFLKKNDLHERPKFDANEGTPVVLVEKGEQGFNLRFRTKASFEKNYGRTVGDGDMVLEALQLYGPKNIINYAAFQGVLPFGLNFLQDIDGITKTLGKPDFASEPDVQEPVFAWNNIKNLRISTVLTPDRKNMMVLTISPARNSLQK